MAKPTKLEALQYQLRCLEAELEHLENNRPKIHSYTFDNSVEEAINGYNKDKDKWYEETRNIRDAKITLKQLIQLETVLNQYGIGDLA